MYVKRASLTFLFFNDWLGGLECVKTSQAYITQSSFLHDDLTRLRAVVALERLDDDNLLDSLLDDDVLERVALHVSPKRT